MCKYGEFILKKIIVRFLCAILICFLIVPEAFSARWRDTNLSVCIVGNNPRNQMMKKAFNEWQTKTNGAVKFYYTNNRSNANIIVSFVQKLNRNQVGVNRIGVTHSRFRGDSMVFAQIEMAAQGQNFNRVLSETEVYATMLHEIGHALGLEHNPNKNSIMYYSTTGRYELSEIDIKNFKTLYGIVD